MSEFNYLQEKVRMLKSLGAIFYKSHVECVECSKCGLSASNNKFDITCSTLELLHPDEAEIIVRKWAEKHPVKTRKDVLLEKFPNAILNDNGYPAACARDLGLTQGCCLDDWCKDCWDTEVEE